MFGDISIKGKWACYFCRGVLWYFILQIPILCDETGYWTFICSVQVGFVSAEVGMSAGSKNVYKEIVLLDLWFVNCWELQFVAIICSGDVVRLCN